MKFNQVKIMVLGIIILHIQIMQAALSPTASTLIRANPTASLTPFFNRGAVSILPQTQVAMRHMSAGAQAKPSQETLHKATQDADWSKKQYDDPKTWRYATLGAGTIGAVGLLEQQQRLWNEQFKREKAEEKTKQLKKEDQMKRVRQHVTDKKLIKAIEKKDKKAILETLEELPTQDALNKALDVAGTNYSSSKGFTGSIASPEIIEILVGVGADPYKAASWASRHKNKDLVQKVLASGNSTKLVVRLKTLENKIKELENELEDMTEPKFLLSDKKEKKEKELELTQYFHRTTTEQQQDINKALYEAVLQKNPELATFIAERGASNITDAIQQLSYQNLLNDQHLQSRLLNVKYQQQDALAQIPKPQKKDPWAAIDNRGW